MARRRQVRRWFKSVMHLVGWRGRRKRAVRAVKPNATAPGVRGGVGIRAPSDFGSSAPERDACRDVAFRDFFGLQLSFTDQILSKLEVPDGKRYIFIGNPRKLFDAPDPMRCLLDHYGVDSVAGSIVGMTSASGGWYRAVACLKSLGVQWFVIMLDPERNERLVPKRVAIPIKAINTIFIPNYKCGYASFRQFCFENFDEFKQSDPDRSSSLNRLVDFSDRAVAECFKFSTIRDPISRFKSLYFDKFCRPDDHVSYHSFMMPVRSLLDKDQLTPADVLEFISAVPDEFSDAHWKSQYFNTNHSGRRLVDSYVRMEHMEEDLEEISCRVDFRFVLPKVLSTAEIARNHKHRTYFEQDDNRERLAQRYPNDFVKLGYT